MFVTGAQMCQRCGNLIHYQDGIGWIHYDALIDKGFGVSFGAHAAEPEPWKVTFERMFKMKYEDCVK